MALKSSQKCQIIFNFKDNLYYQAEKNQKRNLKCVIDLWSCDFISY